MRIDENSEYYSEVSVGLLEYTVETGATYTPGGKQGWQPETVTEYAYVDVPQPGVNIIN